MRTRILALQRRGPRWTSCVASEPLELDDYIKSIGNEKVVVAMPVTDLQRVIEYPKLGFAVEQEVPADVYNAYERLVRAGFDSRLVTC